MSQLSICDSFLVFNKQKTLVTYSDRKIRGRVDDRMDPPTLLLTLFEIHKLNIIVFDEGQVGTPSLQSPPRVQQQQQLGFSVSVFPTGCHFYQQSNHYTVNTHVKIRLKRLLRHHVQKISHQYPS